MTSPPLSETGPTAEAIDLECTGEDDHDYHDCPKCARIRASIALALSAAKRSAHLEDARAAEDLRAKRGWTGDRVCAASTAKWYDGFDRAKAEIVAAIRAKAGER